MVVKKVSGKLLTIKSDIQPVFNVVSTLQIHLFISVDVVNIRGEYLTCTLYFGMQRGHFYPPPSFGGGYTVLPMSVPPFCHIY